MSLLIRPRLCLGIAVQYKLVQARGFCLTGHLMKWLTLLPFIALLPNGALAQPQTIKVDCSAYHKNPGWSLDSNSCERHDFGWKKPNHRRDDGMLLWIEQRKIGTQRSQRYKHCR